MNCNSGEESNLDNLGKAKAPFLTHEDNTTSLLTTCHWVLLMETQSCSSTLPGRYHPLTQLPEVQAWLPKSMFPDRPAPSFPPLAAHQAGPPPSPDDLSSPLRTPANNTTW